MNKLLQISLIIILLSTPAIAAEYYIQAQAEMVNQVNNGTLSWSTPQKFELNKTESISTIGGVTINYYDIMGTDTIWFKITSGTLSDATMLKATTQCVKGDNNGLCNSVGHVKLTLNNIILKTTTTGVSTIDNPFYAYYYVDKEVPLKLDNTRTFDTATYIAQNDLEAIDAPKDIDVYFKSNQNIPFDVTVNGGTKEPTTTWYSNYVKYNIDESGLFTFTVKYKKTNPTGAIADRDDVYKLNIKGLAGSGISVASIAPYQVTLPDAIQIAMTQPGKFNLPTGVTTTSGGENIYVFKFTTSGNYRIPYMSSSGTEVFVEFVVKPPPTITTPAPQQPDDVITANQVQTTTGDNSYLIFAALAIIVVIGIYLSKKKKKTITAPKSGSGYQP